MGLQEAQVLRQHSRAFAVSPSQELGGEDLFIHSGLRSSCLLPELLQPPPCVPHLPGYSLATQGWPSDWRVDAGPSRAPPGPFPRLRLVPVRIGQQAFVEHLQSTDTCAERWTQLSRGQGMGEGVEEARSARGEERREELGRGPRGGQALAWETGCSSVGGRRLGAGPRGALHVLCPAPGLLLPVGEVPVHGWLQHVPRHPHHCHGHPVSLPVSSPAVLQWVQPLQLRPFAPPPGCRSWSSLEALSLPLG